LNTLNEALRGIWIENFEKRLGEPKLSAEQLWKKLSGTYDDWDLDGDLREMTFSHSEITILRNASKVCLDEFDRDDRYAHRKQSIRCTRRDCRP
jgi:hypothetical protein